jgi:hypothetical protein
MLERRHPDGAGGFDHGEDDLVPGNRVGDENRIGIPEGLPGVVEVVMVLPIIFLQTLWLAHRTLLLRWAQRIYNRAETLPLLIIRPKGGTA